MADDVLVNKAAAIERAVRRVRDEHGNDDGNLLTNQTRQDAIILNLQRACESSIDAAMHLVRVRRLGVPQETREAKLSIDIVRSIVVDHLDDFTAFTHVLLRL